MTCPCNDTKRKMPGCDAGTPPVLEVHSKECPVLFHTVTIPASIGDLESMPPQPGAYRNARVIYEADNVTYLYDSDGIPQLLVPDTETIIAEAVSQIPTATTTADGLMSAGDKVKLDNITSVSGSEKVVGEWNGKTLYSRIFTGTLGAAEGAYQTLGAANNSWHIVSAAGYAGNGADTNAFIPINSDWLVCWVGISSGNFCIAHKKLGGCNFEIELRYIKQ